MPLVDFLGGAENAIEVVGYAFLVALIPVVPLLFEIAAATLVALAPWIAIGAAVLLVGVAIQDIVYWMQGKGSLIGSWVGPFEDLKNKMATAVFGPDFLESFAKIKQGLRSI